LAGEMIAPPPVVGMAVPWDPDGATTVAVGADICLF
jgi:hypothetical protein